MRYGTVTGRFLAPDGTPLAGGFRFVPEVSAILVSGVDPATVLPAPVLALLDAAGRVTHDGTPGVGLQIPEAGVTNPVSWTWRVEPLLRHGNKRLDYPSWSIDVTAEGLDLTTAARVPSITGEGITRGMSAYEVWLANGNTGTVDDYLASLAAGGVDLSTYVTDTELTTALVPYATTAYADQAEADAVTTANTYTDQQVAAISAPDLTGYVTDADLTATLSTYATDADLVGKSDTGHVHDIGDVSGLQGALDAKADTADVVLTVGGVAPDENGDVPAPSGGGSTVQDTGWRTVADNTTLSLSRVYLRRVGSTVFSFVLAQNASSTTGNTILRSGKVTGFMPRFLQPSFSYPLGKAHPNGYTASTVEPNVYMPNGNGNISISALAAGEYYTAQSSWHTDDPWPTVLPGNTV